MKVGRARVFEAAVLAGFCKSGLDFGALALPGVLAGWTDAGGVLVLSDLCWLLGCALWTFSFTVLRHAAFDRACSMLWLIAGVLYGAMLFFDDFPDVGVVWLMDAGTAVFWVLASIVWHVATWRSGPMWFSEVATIALYWLCGACMLVAVLIRAVDADLADFNATYIGLSCCFWWLLACSLWAVALRSGCPLFGGDAQEGDCTADATNGDAGQGMTESDNSSKRSSKRTSKRKEDPMDDVSPMV